MIIQSKYFTFPVDITICFAAKRVTKVLDEEQARKGNTNASADLTDAAEAANNNDAADDRAT